jgi:hypothetical protein
VEVEEVEEVSDKVYRDYTSLATTLWTLETAKGSDLDSSNASPEVMLCSTEEMEISAEHEAVKSREVLARIWWHKLWWQRLSRSSQCDKSASSMGAPRSTTARRQEAQQPIVKVPLPYPQSNHSIFRDADMAAAICRAQARKRFGRRSA